MLERNLTADNYYTDTSRSILKLTDDLYTQDININQSRWIDAYIDLRFIAGDQQIWELYQANMPPFRQKQFFFNRIRRVVNMITGYQRRNRKSIVALPTEKNDQTGASKWTKILFSVAQGCNAQEFISEAFEDGTLISGLSLLHTYLDYSEDKVFGDIKLEMVYSMCFMIDPHFKKKDLSDCNYIWRRKWMSSEQLKAVFPHKYWPTLESMKPTGSRDGKFPYMEESTNYSTSNLFTYDEYWYRCYREATYLVDPATGENREYKGSKEDLELFLLLHPSVKKKTEWIPTVRLITMVDGKTLYDGDNPMGIDDFPFVAFWGYYYPELTNYSLRNQGVVRSLRDAQFLYNRRKVIELDILESQINSGFKYKPTSLVNPNDIFMHGQGKGLALKREAEMTDVEQIMAPQIPPSMIQLSEILGREIQEISGINEELLGTADDDKAGILAMVRQGAGLTTLQILFDQLDASSKRLGQLFVKIVQSNFDEWKIARMIGEEAPEEFKSSVWLNFDIQIAEGINTSTQRQMQFVQLMHMREMGIPIPTKTLLEAATIENKDELMKDIMQQEQQQAQAQQAQMQAQIQLLQAQVEELNSRSTLNAGIGVERLSKIEENRAMAMDKLAASEREKYMAALDLAKAMKELQGVDLAQIKTALELVQMIDQDQQQPTQATQQPLEVPGTMPPSN